ncbi:MAG: transcription elongation factor GreA [Chloroflexota bacterium]|nr:transcription elongation factor GreA [Chloroflexota bacterium]
MHPDYVRIGSLVIVRTANGDEERYVIVAARDANPREGRVSSESPIGRALLGRRIGERVVIPAPGGSFNVTIERVEIPTTEANG